MIGEKQHNDLFLFGQIPVTHPGGAGARGRRPFYREVCMRGRSEDPCQLSSRVFHDPHESKLCLWRL